MQTKIKYGICKGECSQEEKAIYSKGYCQYCYWSNNRKTNRLKREQKGESKRKPSKINHQSKKGQKVANEDSKFFREIWNERPHYSEVSGEWLGDDYNPVFFSHVLSKAAFPRARHWKDNIMLKTFNEHQDWEFGDRSTNEFKKKFGRVMVKYGELVTRYYKNKR